MNNTPTHTNFDDIAATDATDDIPEGFRPVKVGGQFILHNGPLYAKWTGQRLLLGFRVEERHTNPLKMCHGGMLAAFAHYQSAD
jgi:acyl-coenzyme A thioesterase PaaI-like protein